jgi:repressor LexA
MQLHPSQQALLKFLIANEDALEELSLWQISRETDLGSAQNVAHHLRQLEKKGYLRRSDNSTFEILKNPVEDVVSVNQYGMASCGHAAEMVSESNLEDKISISTKLFNISDPASIFAVKANGDSMSPNINSGDLVLFQKVFIADSPGQISLVLHNSEPKIKRVVREGKNIILRSFNSEYEDVKVKASDDFEIVGTAKAVIHSLNKRD